MRIKTEYGEFVHKIDDAEFTLVSKELEPYVFYEGHVSSFEKPGGERCDQRVDRKECHCAGQKVARGAPGDFYQKNPLDRRKDYEGHWWNNNPALLVDGQGIKKYSYRQQGAEKGCE